jgi:hypothetical protein
MISAIILVLTSVWFVSAWVFHITNLHSKDGVFGAPVWSLGILLLVPLASLVLAACSIQERRTEGGKLRLIDFGALAAAASPVLFSAGVFLVSVLRYGWPNS